MVLGGPVVVVGEHPPLVLGRDDRHQLEVKPDHIRLVLADRLVDHRQPLLLKSLGRWIARLVRLRVKLGVVRVGGVEGEGRLEVSPGEPVVERGDELQAPLLDRLLQLPGDVAVRSYLDRIPRGDLRIPHRKVVVMHRHWAGEFRPGPGEEIGPGLRVELLGRELRNNVLVADLGLIAETLLMVGKDRVLRDVHLVTVPLAALRAVLTTDRDRPPVRVDTELGVAEPLGVLMPLERFPRRLERSRPAGRRRILGTVSGEAEVCAEHDPSDQVWPLHRRTPWKQTAFSRYFAPTASPMLIQVHIALHLNKAPPGVYARASSLCRAAVFAGL